MKCIKLNEYKVNGDIWNENIRFKWRVAICFDDEYILQWLYIFVQNYHTIYFLFGCIFARQIEIDTLILKLQGKMHIWIFMNEANYDDQ